MFALRLFLFLSALWLMAIVVGVILSAFMPIHILKRMLAVSDNWLFRPVYWSIGWIVEARQLPNRDG